jgi:hypothetical protein
MTVDTLATVLAGIAFDPHIRGVLVMIVAVGVLMGGIWLVMATNLGARLGFLTAFTAFCAWMFVMSAIWTAYGIGLVGERPSWTVKEINVGNLSEAETEQARTVPTDEILPSVEELLEDPDVADDFDPAVTVRLGEIADVDPELIDTSEFDGWEVIGAAELGEPQTAADEALTGGDSPRFESNNDYVAIRGFEYGGKPDREGDSIFDRVTNKITNTLQVTHPTHYAVVQVQQSLPTEVPEGAAPLPPTADPDAPIISVIMVRNLGNLRLPAFILTVVFGLLFALTAYQMHERDKVSMARRASAGVG